MARETYCKHCERPTAVCPEAQAAEVARWLENRQRGRTRIHDFGGKPSRTLGSNRTAYAPR
jgi:ribosomal protein L44E